jgi:hypothetical protein
MLHWKGSNYKTTEIQEVYPLCSFTKDFLSILPEFRGNQTYPLMWCNYWHRNKTPSTQIWASNTREEYVARKHKLHDSKNCQITEKYDWFQSSQVSSFRIQNNFRALRFWASGSKMHLKISCGRVPDSMTTAGRYCRKY